MKRALLVSSSEQSAASLCDLLRKEGYEEISVCDSAHKAKLSVKKHDELDLICINAPLEDEPGVALSELFAAETRSSVVIIVPKSNADKLNELLTGCGVMVIAKPINVHLFHHYLQFADCFRSRILRVTEENEKLRHMVEDMKVINRAKLLLITCLNMSEEQAHRYLEKQAMDLRTSKLQIAKQVINTYEN